MFDTNGFLVTSATPTSWSSSNPGCATVSPTGLVTFVAAGTTNINAHWNSVTSNTCVVTGGTITGTNLAKHDFEDGTLGPFTTQGAPGVDVISDPTPRATGKVARFHYSGGVPTDANLALFPSGFTIGPPGSGATSGDTLWFQGKYYDDVTTDYLRKHVYFKSLALQQNLGHNAQIVAGYQPGSGITGQQIIYATWIDDFGDHTTYISPPYLTMQAWHTIKVHLKVNSAPGVADGISEVWWDGVQEYSVTNVSWGGAGYPASWTWDWFAIGMQVDAAVAVDEFRYWDDLSFATTEAAL